MGFDRNSNSSILLCMSYRDEENQIKNESARVVTTLYSYTLDVQGQLTL